MTREPDTQLDPTALSAETMIDRYRQLRDELRDNPQSAATIQPLMDQLREQWKAYNGGDDLAELATGDDEAL